MVDCDPIELVRLGRFPDRGSYDFETVAGILDATMLCHVGFTVGRQPLTIPTVYGRRGQYVYIHSSALTRWMQRLTEPIPLCLSVTIVDAVVLARSAFNHTLNYRSVVILGEAEAVVDGDERLTALETIMEHVCPGRWNDVRHPTRHELDATLVLRINIATASAKVRSGPPDDPEKERGKGIWAGIVPLCTVRESPVADPQLESGIPIPDYLL